MVLLACTGPVVAALSVRRVFWGRTRPVLVTGLPGISVPATSRAVTSRAACDLFLLHSKREVAEFSEIGATARAATRLRVGPTALLACPIRQSQWLMPSSGPIWCSRRRQRCQLSGPTGNRSCWRWPRPGLPWSSSAPGRRNGRPTTKPGPIPTSWTTWWHSAASRGRRHLRRRLHAGGTSYLTRIRHGLIDRSA